MQGGTVEMTVMNASLLAGVSKEMAIFDFPFMFNNAKEADAVSDGPVGKKLLDKLQEKGLVGLAYWDLGFRQVHTGKKPIAKADDFNGVKMRVIPTPIYVDFMKSLGASPVPMPFTETYTALEQGAIDGMTNPLLNILDGKYDEVSKYLTITNHMYTPQAVVVSKKFWDKLTPAEQKLMREAAQETAVYQRKVARDEATKVLAEVKKKGMTVLELNAEEIAKLRERSKPVVEKYTKELGPIVDEMYAAVDKARKSK
jgi:tripartite ATP-independent transporter DctP family solute receptor